MLRVGSRVVLIGSLALGASCTVLPPTGPSVVALPAKGVSFEQFQHDDATCQQFASAQTGGASPAQAATDSGVASAAFGTVLGATAGALIGAAAGNVGAGAAIGAGSGLLLGSTAGTGHAYASAAGLQQRYDARYVQCMSAKGHSVPTMASAPAPYGYGYPRYAYRAYPAYPPYYAPYPGYYGYYPGYAPY